MVTLERQAPRSLTFGASNEEKKQTGRCLVSHAEKGESRSHIPSRPDSNQRGSPRRAPYPPHLQQVYKGLLSIRACSGKTCQAVFPVTLTPFAYIPLGKMATLYTSGIFFITTLCPHVKGECSSWQTTLKGSRTILCCPSPMLPLPNIPGVRWWVMLASETTAEFSLGRQCRFRGT